MSKELMKLEDKGLQLVIKSQKMGELETNALQIKDYVKKVLAAYGNKEYSAEDLKTAKEDKAVLNKAAKALNDERIKVEKAWMAPFETFKSTVKETCDLIKECASKIDEVVKKAEEEEREEKRKQVLAIFEKPEVKNALPEPKAAWNDKWLNKTASIKSIEKEIDAIVEKVTNDLSTLETLYKEDIEAVKIIYIKNLDINEAIEYGKQLAEAKKEQEKVHEEAFSPKTEEAEKVEEKVSEEVSDGVDDAFAAIFGEEAVEETPTKPEESTLVLKLTESQKRDLESYLLINNIEFVWK